MKNRGGDELCVNKDVMGFEKSVEALRARLDIADDASRQL